MKEIDLNARLDLAIDAARRAGELTLRYFNRPDLNVERKRDGTPVTVADREAEDYLRKRIIEVFPADAILGEEEGEAGAGSSGRRWIVDPIDGTKNYVRGIPVFATLVALEEEGRLVLGLVSAPALGTRWVGCRRSALTWPRAAASLRTGPSGGLRFAMWARPDASRLSDR